MSGAHQGAFLPPAPGGWTVGRFGRDITINEGQVDPREEPWASAVLIAPNHIESGTGRILGLETASEQGADSGKYLATKGQVLYSKIRPALNKVAIAPEDCLCSADMYAIEADKNVDPGFLAYFMRARPFHAYVSITADRVKMPKVNREELSAAPWMRPPLVEQRAIADFLDEQTSRIDTLIGKQNQLIDTLRERRVATIHRAVTSSPKPDAREARSPFSWIDAVPIHWRIGPLRHFIHFTTGWTPSTTDDESYLGQHRWANISDLGAKTISATAKSLSDRAVAGQTPSLPGDLLFSFKLSVGRVSLVGSPMFTNEAIATFRSSDSLLADYAYYALPVFVPRNANTNIYGAALLNSALIRSAPFACPPIEEQKEITAYLDEQTSRIDALIARTEMHIALARERRAALITAAVTGQIDVRTARRAATVDA